MKKNIYRRVPETMRLVLVLLGRTNVYKKKRHGQAYIVGAMRKRLCSASDDKNQEGRGLGSLNMAK